MIYKEQIEEKLNEIEQVLAQLQTNVNIHLGATQVLRDLLDEIKKNENNLPNPPQPATIEE